ncbi:MAG: hypothetical protein JNM80_10930 [Phycisphaerae bacterium]|nr:hypothetical protein [Phycisphaerae bacterium]
MRRASAILSLASLAAIAGCVSWANFPPVPGDTAFHSPSLPAMEDVMVEGLRWTITRYPPNGQALDFTPGPAEQPRLAINLPTGVKAAFYDYASKDIGGPRRLVTPLASTTSDLPIYHVRSLRIRGDEAQINIIRPATELGLAPTGQPVYQEVTLTLRGGVGPWRVVSATPWSPGSEDIPAPNYYDRLPDLKTRNASTPARPASEASAPDPK